MIFCAVVVAAGRGTRFGQPKQLVGIAGKPMLAWSLEVFARLQRVGAIVVVTEAQWLEHVRDVAVHAAGPKLHAVVAGGPTRQASTYHGLRAVPAQHEGVFVHDGARPLIAGADVIRGMDAVSPGHGALLATPVVDTIKVVDDVHVVQHTLDRAVLWAAQTPQFATYADLMRAHEEGLRDGIDATDDAMLLERAGIRVRVIPGSPENFKVTLAEDRARASAVMHARVTQERA